MYKCFKQHFNKLVIIIITNIKHIISKKQADLSNPPAFFIA